MKRALKEMFPENLYEKALHSEDYSQQLDVQRKAYVKAYLDKIGSKAEVGKFDDYNRSNNLVFSDFPIQALELLWEKYSDYDTWLGSGERLIDGVRHVYQVSTDGKRTITYHHYLKDSNKTLEKSIVTIFTKGKKAYIDCLQEGARDSEHYEIALKR